jgi:hypothetical protein
VTTRTEVLALAAECQPCDGRQLLVSYERWFRQRGDRQAARYWKGDDKAFAELAAENYVDAEALRTAATAKPEEKSA